VAVVVAVTAVAVMVVVKAATKVEADIASQVQLYSKNFQTSC